MVDTTKASESNYMTVDTVRESPTKKIVFIDEGEYTTQEYKGKTYEKFEITVQIDGKTKIYAPNKDTVKNIQMEFGKDSKNWIGKIARLQISKANGKDIIMGMPMPILEPQN